MCNTLYKNHLNNMIKEFNCLYIMKSELHMYLTKNVMTCKVIRNFYK